MLSCGFTFNVRETSRAPSESIVIPHGSYPLKGYFQHKLQRESHFEPPKMGESHCCGAERLKALLTSAKIYQPNMDMSQTMHTEAQSV